MTRIQPRHMIRTKKEITLSLVLTMLAAVALSVDGSVLNENASFLTILLDEIHGLNLGITVITVFLFAFEIRILRFVKQNSSIETCLASMILAFFMIIGLSFSANGDLSFILANGRQALFSALVFAGFVFLFEVVVSFLFFGMSRLSDDISSPNRSTNLQRIQWKYFWILIIAWLPFMVVFWPGSVPHDGYLTVNMAFGVQPFTNHHPWPLTYVIKLLMPIGFKISDNWGVFVCTALFYLIEAYCYSRVCRIVAGWSRKAGKITLLFFAIVPIWGMYAQALQKDGLFSAVYALFFAECILAYFEREQVVTGKQRMLQMVKLLALGIATCHLRNNGIYLCVPQLVVLTALTISKNKKHWRIRAEYVTCMVVILVVYYLTQGPIMRYLGIKQTRPAEMLSIPFQQTARYLKYYPDDITDEEFQTIHAILPDDNLGKNYNPDFADPVKNKYRPKATRKEMKAYFRTWFSLLKRHPKVYIESFIAGSFGYYYPFSVRKTLGTYQNYMKEPEGSLLDNGFDFHFVVGNGIREKMTRYTELWKNVPVLSLIMNPGTYAWLLILAGLFILHKKQQRIAVLNLISPLLNIAVCMASPVNGFPRYAMPLMACMPIIVVFSLYVRKSSEN